MIVGYPPFVDEDPTRSQIHLKTDACLYTCLVFLSPSMLRMGIYQKILATA